MLENLIKKIFGDPSEKKVKYYTSLVKEIHSLEEKFKDYDLEKVKQKTKEFKELFKDLDFEKEEDAKKIKELLDKIKLEAFALVKHTTKLLNGKTFELKDWKTLEWNMIPYDVQLVGWLAIHDWNIAEMKTWEWKTLVATMPAYLNALTWNPVHIVTVNDYLAKRDSEEMWILYNALWLEVGFITHDQDKRSKKENYSKDIVYGTNNELGFDYLRDNMVIKKEDKVQSRLFFAIIDEVDSILIDEARTPLIISMPDNEPTSKYLKFAQIAKQLQKWVDYKIDEKQKTATLTEAWIEKIEKMLKVDNIYVSAHYNDLHHIENAIKAEWVYIKDKDYIVHDWEVLIVDEHTWRVLPWRRYSDWLHQAIEAKEWVEIQQESKTLASITFQNFFRMYWKLAWMTGTAKTEEEEFYKVYWLETLVIPTNKPVIREDRKDLLFKNEKWKFEWIVKEIKRVHKTWQPILVWTVSVDKSEYLSQKLKEAWIPHNVLNAKHHKQEAEIVAKAWEKWAVTIATNMAWRWTDIKLWEWVKELGGLYIIWSEKHETRRIDNQLRWRAWRQWDPWITQFLVSPNDDIMRIFGWDKLFSAFNSPVFASLPDDEPLINSWMLTRKITSVQKQVEWYNFDIRKHVLQYDDVINKHREIIYSKRNKILDSENIEDDIKFFLEEQIRKIVNNATNVSDWTIDHKKVIKDINDFLERDAINDKIELDDVSNIEDKEELTKYIVNIALEELEEIKKKAPSLEEFYDLERRIVLSSIDELWMRHIDSMSKLREEVAFEWYAQKDPLVVYKEKAFHKFENLMDEIWFKVIKALFAVDKVDENEVEQVNIDLENIDLNDKELNNLLNNLNWTEIKSDNLNPLLNNSWSSNVEVKKTKIRV